MNTPVISLYESDPPPVAVPLAPTERSVNAIPSPPPPALEAFTHLLVAASHLIVCVSCIYCVSYAI